MGCTLSQCSKEEVEKRVTVLLRNFALAAVSSPPATSQGVTSRQTQKLFMDAVTLVRRYSPEIAQYFRIQSAPPSMNTTSLATCIEGLVQPMAFGQKSSPFHRVIGNHSEEDEESDDDSDLEDALLGQFHKVQDSLVSCASFLQLALQLRRDLYSHDRAEKEAVNNAVLESLLPASISDTNVSSQLRVKWDIKDFMLRQYGEMVPLRSVVVLIGTVLYAQATTCGEYIQANWPETGPFVLDMIESCVSAVDLLAPTKHGMHTKTHMDDVILHAVAFEDCSPTTSLVIYSGYVEAQMVNASPRITSEVTQVLAWLGAAVRLSPHEENLSYSRPSLRPLPVNSESIRIVDSKLEIDYRCEPLHETEKACWLPLFQGAVITPGFPIPNRAEETGLEISLDLVAGIVGARHAVEYAGGIVLKGFSHMIVPVQRKGNCVQWHTVTNADTQSRLTYNDGLAHCGTRALIGELNFADLHHTRAIVGWCSVATSRLGSDAADYENIDYSDAKVAGSVVRCAGGQIGFQQFGTGAVDFRLGIKEGNLHIPRLGRYVKIVSAAEKTPVLLYDTGNRRAWLVSASDVLLHMAKHRHCLDPFEVDDKQIILETTVADGMSARSVLLRNEKQKLSDDNYIFRDLILDFWSQLERLVDQNMVREQNTQGVAVKASFREYLRGYELKAIVEERSPFVMKEQELLKTNGGWPKLVRDINALVLFADELGEVLLPADERQVRLCSLWRRVPSNCDYLATTSKILVDLYNVSGCRTSRKFLTSTELRWHCGTSCLFEDCKDVRTCRCNRLQQIIPNASLGSVVCPDTIADHGAVIFGHSGSLLNDVFPWSGAATRQESNMYSQLNSPLLFVETSSTSHDETSTSEQSGQSASDGTSDSHLSSLSTCTTQSTHDTTPDLHPTPPRVTQEQTGCSRKRLRFPNRTVKLSNQQKESYKTFETIEPSTIGVKRQRKVSGEDLHEYCQPV